MGERHVVVEVLLMIHDGDEIAAFLDDDGPSVTLQIADVLDIVDNRIQITYLVNHDEVDEDGPGTHMHTEPGRIIKIRLDDEQWVDFTAGRELGGPS